MFCPLFARDRLERNNAIINLHLDYNFNEDLLLYGSTALDTEKNVAIFLMAKAIDTVPCQ